MPKYLLTVCEAHYETLEVEAEDEDAAFEMFDTRVGEFETGDIDTDWYTVDERVEDRWIECLYVRGYDRRDRLLMACKEALEYIEADSQPHDIGGRNRALSELRSAMPGPLDLPTAVPLSRIGRMLWVWRQDRELTQAQVAERAGISAQHLSDVERGQRNPSLETLGKVLAVYDIQFRYVEAHIIPESENGE